MIMYLCFFNTTTVYVYMHMFSSSIHQIMSIENNFWSLESKISKLKIKPKIASQFSRKRKIKQRKKTNISMVPSSSSLLFWRILLFQQRIMYCECCPLPLKKYKFNIKKEKKIKMHYKKKTKKSKEKLNLAQYHDDKKKYIFITRYQFISIKFNLMLCVYWFASN